MSKLVEGATMNRLTEAERAKPRCLFCGELADHKCGNANDCGGCCAVRGGLATDSPEAYRWVENVVRPQLLSLRERVAELEQGWIPVSERLPEVGEWCWVVYSGNVQRMAARLALVGDPDTVIAGNAKREWRWADDDADPCPFKGISHWKPITAPPTEKEE